MSKNQSPPGHQETTLATLQADIVVLRQRCSRMDVSWAETGVVLVKELEENKKCTTGAGIIALIAFLLALGHIAWDVWRAWS